MNAPYASGSLLYRSREVGAPGGKRLRSEVTTRRPISSCTSKTLSSTKSCVSAKAIFCVTPSNSWSETRHCPPRFWTLPCSTCRTPRSRHAPAGSAPAT